MTTATATSLFLPDSEREVIAGILMEPAKLADVRPLLSPECFGEPHYRLLWLALCETEDRDIAGDIPALCAILKAADATRNWTGELLQLVVPSGTFVAHHARLLAGAAQMRALRAVVEEIGAALEDLRPSLPGSVEAMRETAEALIYTWQTSASATQPIAAGEGARAVIQDLDSPEPAGLMCGLDALDETCCGLAAGTLTVIAARTSQGKSTLGLQIALNLAYRGLAALFVSLEMSEKQTMRRALSNIAGVNHARILRKDVPADDRGLLEDGAAKLQAYGDRLQVYSPHSVTPTMLRSLARRLRARHRNAVLIVDYLQLLEMPDEDTREQRVSAASRSLKQTAEIVGLPVIVLAQLNRAAVHDDQPQLHHLRESGAIEQDADTVLLLQVAAEDESSLAESIPMRVHVAKNRAGPRAIKSLVWKRPIFRIEDQEPLGAAGWSDFAAR